MSTDIHKSRLLTTIFTFSEINPEMKEYRLAVCNMHLEGNPQDPQARLNQINSTLTSLKNEIKPDGLVMCGDFNCEYDSAVSI